jgi:glycosyltransferase involved in cell wall biosynthesis
LQALAAADWAYSPTRWQHSRLPPEFKAKTVVLFDGIDTKAAKPDAKAQITLQRAGVTLRAGDEVLTFVNRNLEPYRGFHTFMRALPTILKARPKAHCLIVGRDSVSYGSPPRGGGTWRDALLAEVGAQLPPDRVHFLGGLPYRAYLQVLQVSGCHVYLTYPFVLSWSCLEALSAQCTLVASDTGPVREVIEDGVNGLLFDFFKPADLAARAIDVLSAPQNFRKLGLSGRQMVINRYDLDSICLPQLTQRLLAT